MKHLIKKWTNWSAGCSRLGCAAGLEGRMGENMTQKDLESFFSKNCPVVFNPNKRVMTHKESVDYLLSRAKQEIKDWNKLIKYWTTKKNDN